MRINAMTDMNKLQVGALKDNIKFGRLRDTMVLRKVF